jgi:hypothetical protein
VCSRASFCGLSERDLPEYWGWMFCPVNNSKMERVKLPTFYKFGAVIGELRVLDKSDFVSNTIVMNLAFKAGLWIVFFFNATDDIALPHTRDAANNIYQLLDEYKSRLAGIAVTDQNKDDVLGELFVQRLNQEIDAFELMFEREARRVSVFAVQPKGLYDTEKLIEEGEKKFPPDLIAVMPPQVIEDIREAGRCLAFDRSTACAFHICRATEGLMRAYYKKLTGLDWPPPPPKPKMAKDWKVLVDQLRVEGAPKKIIERLGELREDRNSYAHPDVTVPVDEAPIVYETCTFAMFYIAKELVGSTP